MDKKPIFFLGIALAQLAVPVWMVVGHERVLREGEVFKFRTAPIDPRDPFRGEYVRLDFEAEQGSWAVARPDDISTGEQKAYAVLARDSAGFAWIPALVAEPPANGAFVEAEYLDWDNDSVSRVGLHFNRFYLEEGDGARTERMLMPRWDEDVREDPLPAYALVRVLNGRAVIEDLIVGNRSIHEWLKEPEEKSAISRTVTAVPSSQEAAGDSLVEEPLPDEAP
ncbi:MAG: GDYXXLXY domain-containing protein [Flavobacteriales bacterium]|nr:GDYXXLXY domain-containing protein [Flavobacteriales bacterium]